MRVFLSSVSLYILVSFCVCTSAVKAEERVAEEVLQQTFQDWVYACAMPSGAEVSGPLQCEIFQSLRIKDEETEQLVELAKVALSKANDKAGKLKWALVVMLPLGLDVHLPSGIEITVGKGKSLSGKFRNCTPSGCLVVVPVSQSIIVKFKRMKEGALVFRSLNGQNIRLVFSLLGFTRALSGLESGAVPIRKTTEPSYTKSETDFNGTAGQ